MTGFIYCITNDVNGKQYVGKTVDSIEKRFKEHLNDCTKTRCEKRPLYDAMNKYGIEHFQVKQLEECDLSILAEREKYWINALNTFHNGYNATHGGDGKQLYDYDAFINDFKQGLGILAIARKYNCDQGTVSAIIKKAGYDTYLNSTNTVSIAVAQYTMQNEYIQTFHSSADAGRYIQQQKPELKGTLKSIRERIRKASVGISSSAYGYKWRRIE